MGKYSVPEEIRKLKPVGTSIKVIKGNYYVYSHSQAKDPITGKWKTLPGKLLGKIVPGVGFCPKKDASTLGKITCFCYGEYLLATHLAKNDFLRLKEAFNPDEAMQLFALAIIYAVNGYIGIGAAIDEYEHSLIARDYPELKFSRHIITKLVSKIGLQDKMYEFQKKCVEEASEIAVDGHVVSTDSDLSDLSYLGYKAKALKSEQMNLMVALDVNAKTPIATRVFPGYMVDSKDFSDFVNHIGSITGKFLIMDRGFNTEDNRNFIKNNNAQYLMPVPSIRNDYKNALSKKRGRMAQFIYYITKSKTDMVEYREFASKEGTRIILFKNLSENERLSKAYLNALEEGRNGYSKSIYEKDSPNYGSVVLETNSDKEAKELYNLYKSRWSIETFYDRLKNGLNFTELGLSDYGMIQGISFVMLLAGRIDSSILSAAKKTKMTRKDLVRLMSGLKLIDKEKLVSIENKKKEHNEVAEKLGFDYNPTIKCLD